jgi:signal peptidase I
MAAPMVDPIKSYNVPYEAMEPAIPRGSEVKGDRSYYFKKKPARWDVVVFLAPEVSKMGSNLGLKRVSSAGKCIALINAAADMYKSVGEIYRPQIYYVKRIIGLPGETIQFTPEGLLINGKKARVPPHLKERFSSFKRFNSHKYAVKPYQIPQDSVFLVGDNTEIEVMDSRVHGAVPIGNLEARVLDVD